MFKVLALLFLSLSVNAEYKLFLDFTVEDQSSLQQLDEALKVGSELRATIKSMEAKNITTEGYSNLKEKLKRYESEMLKVYGLYPGLEYKMVSTSGYIFHLIPEKSRESYLQKGFKIPVDSPTVIIKNKANLDVKCLKVKIKLLQKRESVIQFNQSLMAAGSLRQQIQNLEEQLNKKPELKKQEEIQQGMSELKEALKSIEIKMNERFGVRNEGKYIFEPKSGAVYLALNKKDLEKLSNLKKASNK